MINDVTLLNSNYIIQLIKSNYILSHGIHQNIILKEGKEVCLIVIHAYTRFHSINNNTFVDSLFFSFWWKKTLKETYNSVKRISTIIV